MVVILALVTALVGPQFVDWGQYRTEFEAAASRLTGLQVRVAGQIDARILPSPTLIVHNISFARPGEVSRVRAGTLRVEFALGELMRGEWRAAEVSLQGAEVALGIDRSGRLDWPAPVIGLDPERISIQQLRIVDSRIILADAISGTNLLLDRFEFKGELRSLAGPLKGEGSFLANGLHYPYRLAIARAGEDGSVRIRANLDPIDRPVSADIDATLSIEGGAPRFDGALQLVRGVGRAPKGAAELIIEPWRLSSRLHGDSAAAVLEQIEFQYGPEDRAIRLRGDARIAFGSHPELEGVLSSLQIDLDRLLGLPEPARRSPIDTVRALADRLIGAQRLPLPVRLGLSAETVTLAGAPLQRVSGDIRIDGDALDIEALEFRAPGLTQIRLSGRLGLSAEGLAFAGPIRVDAGDASTLAAWIASRPDALPGPSGVLRASGELKLGGETMVIERLAAEIDRAKLEGRITYGWRHTASDGEHPPRFDVALSASEIDLDRAGALAQGLLGGLQVDWPQEGRLALKIGRATLAGVVAKDAEVRVRLDAAGIDIERLAFGDFGGTALRMAGHIDTSPPAPRGSLTVDLDARGLEGIAAVTERFAPTLAEQMRRTGNRFLPASFHAALSVDGQPASSSTVSLKLEGNAGTFRFDVEAETGVLGAGLTLAELPQLTTERLGLKARIDAGNGSALVELLGLDRLVAVDQRAGRFELNANGPFNGDLELHARLTAGGLDTVANGTVRLPGQRAASADLSLKVSTANLRNPRPVAVGRLAAPIPAVLGGKLSFADTTVTLADLSGKLGEATIGGSLQLDLAQPARIDGQIEVSTLDLPTGLAALLGVPVQGQPASGSMALWPVEPFEAGLIGQVIVGRIALRAAKVGLSHGLTASDVSGTLQGNQTTLAISDFDGALAGGRLSGHVTLERGVDGVSARSRLSLAGADAGLLMPGSDGRTPPIAGRLDLDLETAGAGRSPIALIGSLKGGGSFTLQEARIARLDPTSFGAVARAVEQGLPIDANRIRDRMEFGLANGGLRVALAQGAIVISDGQVQLGQTLLRGDGAELGIAGRVDLPAGSLDARLSLVGLALPGSTVAGGRPEVTIGLKGPIEAARRTLDVNALASFLAMRAVELQAKRINALEGPGVSSSMPAALAKPTDGNVPASEVVPETGSMPRPGGASAIQIRPRPSVPPSQPPASAQDGLKKGKPGEPSATGPMDIRPTLRPNRYEPARPSAASPAASSGTASTLSVGP
jgi:uncharacterized protein involved in outer membrane biogenesis